MTDIKEPINTTSDGTFSGVRKTPKKMLLAKSSPQPPQELPPCLVYHVAIIPHHGTE